MSVFNNVANQTVEFSNSAPEVAKEGRVKGFRSYLPPALAPVLDPDPGTIRSQDRDYEAYVRLLPLHQVPALRTALATVHCG